MADLKLARMPDRTPVKLTLLISPDLKVRLEAYFDLYCATYGESKAVLADIIPPMLSSFLTEDKAFQRHWKIQNNQKR